MQILAQLKHFLLWCTRIIRLTVILHIISNVQYISSATCGLFFLLFLIIISCLVGL